MKPYIVIKSDTIHDLELKVGAQMINDMYKPIGGIFSVQKKGSTYSWFYQAMVLMEDTTNDS